MLKQSTPIASIDGIIMTTPTYDQQSPDTSAFLDQDDNVQDIQSVLESGQVVVQVTNTPDPLTPVGVATVPTYEQLTAWVGKFLNSDNDLIDLLEFLTSGVIKVQVFGGVAPTDATYITSTDETSTLPNSLQLLGTADQIIVTDGVLSLPDDLILPGTLTLTGLTEGIIKTPDGKNLTLAPGNPNLDWVDLQSKKVNILESLIFNNASTNNIFYNSETNAFYFTANNDRILTLSSGGVVLGADLLLETHKITSSAGTAIQLIPDNDSDGIDLASTIVRVEADIRHAGDETNKISFTTAAQTNYIGGSSIYDINASGFRLGMGSRVSTISNDAASVLDTQLLTAYATETKIANALTGANPFQGFWDASGGTFPATAGDGGPIVAGDWWRISVAGILGGSPVSVGNQIFAVVDVPGQTAGNWSIINPRVSSVFTRTGPVVAESGDYSYDQITGLPATATSGKLMRGNGSAWVETTATYPNTVATNDILIGGGTDMVSSLATANSSILGTDASGNLGWKAITQYNVLSGGASGAINNITPSTSGYVLTSNGASAQPTFQAAAFVPPTYNTVTASTQALAINNTYRTTYAGLCVMSMPATAAVGSIIRVRAGQSGNTFKITFASGQLAYYGAQNGVSVATASDGSGYLQSVDPNTTVDLECVVANTTWMVVSNVNNLTVA